MTTDTKPKPGTPPGTKFTEEHRANLSKSMKDSVKAKRHRRRLASSLEGKAPSDLAIARSLATRKLKKMGLTREGSPELFERYTRMFLKQRAGTSDSTP